MGGISLVINIYCNSMDDKQLLLRYSVDIDCMQMFSASTGSSTLLVRKQSRQKQSVLLIYVTHPSGKMACYSYKFLEGKICGR